MTIRIAINGYGRIGRTVLRTLYDEGHRADMRVVAINDLADVNANAHLTRHDTVHGRFGQPVRVDGNAIFIGDDKIACYSSKSPATLPWGELGVDVVLECTGVMTSREAASRHLEGGAKKVLISAPASGPVDATVVYGVNHDTLRAAHTVVSNASCTTNCLAPLAKVLHARLGIASGLMTTIHSYTNDQVLTDVNHRDLYRARAAAHNLIPTRTGAAAGIGLVLPELDGRLDGLAIRVPTINVSLVDLTFVASRKTSVEEVNNLVRAAAASQFAGILGYNEEPLVSSDFNHDSRSSIFDATQTRVSGGNLVKVLAWYDNEWGFASRMLDTAAAMMAAR